MKSTRRFLLLLLLAVCSLLLTACYQEIDPWPETPAQTAAPIVTQAPAAAPQPTAEPEGAPSPTAPPLTQPGLNG